MPATLAYLHGMNISRSDARDYASAIEDMANQECHLIYFGDVLTEHEDDDTTFWEYILDLRQKWDTFIREYLPEELINNASSRQNDPVKAIVDFDTWVTPVLERRTQFHHLMETVESQLAGITADQPVVLVAHSLGTVVGLHLMHTASASAVRNYITLGSPLGLLGAVTETVIPPRIRQLDIPWTNIHAKEDVVALRPILPADGYGANPLHQIKIEGKFPDAHTSYFFEPSAREKWTDVLREALS